MPAGSGVPPLLRGSYRRALSRGRDSVLAGLTAHAGNRLKPFTPNGPGACPQDRLFARLPHAPVGSKGRGKTSPGQPGRSARRSRAALPGLLPAPLGPCGLARPVRHLLPSPPPAARLPLWRRTCGALPQRTQELLTGQAAVARLRVAFRDLGRRTGLAVPPTVAAIVNSPLSFVSGTRRTPNICLRWPGGLLGFPRTDRPVLARQRARTPVYRVRQVLSARNRLRCCPEGHRCALRELPARNG